MADFYNIVDIIAHLYYSVIEMRLCKILLIVGLAVWLHAQTPVFDVASIKLNTSGETNSQVRILSGGRLIAVNASLRAIITTAYQIQDFELEGGPGWVATDRYDIDARVSGSPEPEEILRMLQALLADRFKLVLRREQRQKSIYLLTASPGGPKLESPHDECSARFIPTAPTQPLCGGFHQPVLGQARGASVTMARLAVFLSRQVGRPVVDKTGLDGTYDLTLKWTPDSTDASEPMGGSIFTAVREQLGLRLEAERGPAPTMIIDSVEKPSPN